MDDAWVSVAALAAAVLLSELVRRAAARLLRGAAGAAAAAMEAASTFQLCCCTHELKLLADAGLLEPAYGLTLGYFVTVVHLLSFRGASCNPCGVAERVCRGKCRAGAALASVAGQFVAGLGARYAAAATWSLGLAGHHVRQRRFGFRCFDPLGGTVLEAAAVELGCAFVVQATALHIHKVDHKLRVPVFAAVITALVYAGGRISGAVFNPVLAFSVIFPCSGHAYLEYCFIYWLGPALGVASCVLLFEKVLPFLSGTNAASRDSKRKAH